MKIIRNTAVCIALASLWHAEALALDPAKALTQFTHSAWLMEDGLPQNSIKAIAQTTDGYMWLATQAGIVRFDGVRFTVFNTANTPALTNSNVMALLAGRDGSLWIGTYGGGLTRSKDGTFTTYTTRDGLAHDVVFALCEDAKGNLWIGTHGGGLSRWRDGRFTTLSTKNGLSNNFVRAIHEDRQGDLWIGTDGGGLNKLSSGQFAVFGKAQGLPSDIILSIREDRHGSLWVGTFDGGLSRRRDGRFTTYAVKEGLPSNAVYAISEDRDGSLWVGTHGGGLSRWDGGRFTSLTTEYGLAGSGVRAIYEDREGSLWIGTAGSGLHRIKDGKFTTFTTAEGLSSNMVYPVYEDRAGDVWIGTEDRGLNRLSGGRVSIYTTRQGLASDHVWSIEGGRDGSLWLGTGGGLSRLENGSFTSFTTREGLSSNMVWAVHEGRDGSFWIGTFGGGLNRLKDGRFDVYTSRDGLPDTSVRAIQEDAAGTLWIGTSSGGVARLSQGRFTAITTKDGLSSNVVRSLYVDQQGTVWIGTLGGGLNRLKNGRITVYTTRNGLFDDVIWLILEDGRGNLWMSSSRGIFRVGKQDLNDFADGRITSVASVAYGEADGVKSSQGVGGSQSVGWKGRDGRLWFSTFQGVSVVDPQRLSTNAVPPPVIIEQILVDGEALAADARVPAGRQKFEFHCLAATMKTHALVAHQKGLGLACRVQPDVPDKLVGDPGRLRQILINLLGNAIKFTDRGEIVVEVSIAAGEPQTAADWKATVELRLAVTDTGIGISAEQQRLIFEPFSQADTSITRQYGGTGLGLTISSRLVGMMGGRLAVESVIGRGSTFSFTTRLGHQSTSSKKPALASLAPRPTERADRPLRVLLAEDNRVNRMLAIRLLEKRGHSVAVAGNGREALEATEQRIFDVVLMDLEMPEMSGLEATAAIRRREQRTGTRLPIIAMTAHAMIGDRERCLAAGMDGYVSKPVHADELYAALENATRKHSVDASQTGSVASLND